VRRLWDRIARRVVPDSALHVALGMTPFQATVWVLNRDVSASIRRDLARCYDQPWDGGSG
jgi:hypothetical protein